ncbi:hypothetical protein [Roseateles sp.]|uniref:hypothetical protein n=1 Tax=Roseateles sp. TaxID=1971397 RepID=UPI003D113624
MAKGTIGQFGYELLKRTKDQPIPVHPFIRLCLQHWDGTLEQSAAPVISGHLITEQEILTHIQLLKEDLDKVGAEAIRALHKAVVAHKADPNKN